MIDLRNVSDKYKGWMEDLIKEDMAKHFFPYGVLMEHIQGDFNFGSVIRSGNAFGVPKIFYVGKKKWDRRSSCGTHHYSHVKYIEDIKDSELIDTFNFVALEQCDDSVNLQNFTWPDNPLIIVGEEGNGISEELLSLCQYKVEIPQFGSVRSLNAATAVSIAMYDFITKFTHNDKVLGIKNKTIADCEWQKGC